MTDLPVALHGSASERRDLVSMIAFWCGLVVACIRRTPPWLYIVCIAPPALVLAAVFAQPYIEPSTLLRDPAVVYQTLGIPGHTPMYYGFISNLGVLIWGSAMVVCLFVGLLLAVRTDDRCGSVFMLSSGLITGVLVVDDFFMIHDFVFPYTTSWDGSFLILIYALSFAAYFIYYTMYVLRRHTILLFVASAFFAFSAGLDAMIGYSTSNLYWFLEDGSKFFGIFAWVTFYHRAAWVLLVSARFGQDR